MVNLPLNLVKNLYYKEKLSTIEIAKRLRVTPWIVIRYMKKLDLPRRTLKETNQIVFARKPKSFDIKQNLSQKEEKLKTAGIMLYWAEGSKMNSEKRILTVDFTNSNPLMVKLFLKFLRRICRVDEKRLRVLLYCYNDQNIEYLKKFWHKITNINLKQFTKPYIRKDFLPEKSGKMKYGLVHIRYCDKKLLIQIGDWIKQYLKENSIRVGAGEEKRTSL